MPSSQSTFLPLPHTSYTGGFEKGKIEGVFGKLNLAGKIPKGRILLNLCHFLCYLNSMKGPDYLREPFHHIPLDLLG